jgi:hypothetical protein
LFAYSANFTNVFFSEFGNLSKELVTITHVGAMSLFVGGVYGGIQNSKGAYMDFIQNNQATAFHDHIEAKVIFLKFPFIITLINLEKIARCCHQEFWKRSF